MLITMGWSDSMAIYYLLIRDRYLLQPDLSDIPVQSVLGCIVNCLLMEKAIVTFNVWSRNYDFSCQCSKRKATCMEKEEADVIEGCRMFQKKVII
jgi:hypothetical protein